MKLEYRSLQTDTLNEQIFFDQEIAALAAGRQGKMWNYALTFAHEQESAVDEYATEEFLTDIASQVPDLKLDQWRRDRGDPLLSRQVGLGVYAGHQQDLYSTPSFLLDVTASGTGRSGRLDASRSLRKKIEVSLKEVIESLREEEWDDVPTFGTVGLTKGG